MQIDDSYYLKALDNYPYDLEEVTEALRYGLSSNPEHAGLLTLQGRIYVNELQSPEEAVRLFTAAIAYEPDYLPAYYELGRLYINRGQKERARELIAFATARLGCHQPKLIHLKALLAETEKRYRDAIELLEEAKQNCIDSSDFEYYDDETRRVNKKTIRPLTIGDCKVYYSIK